MSTPPPLFLWTFPQTLSGFQSPGLPAGHGDPAPNSSAPLQRDFLKKILAIEEALLLQTDAGGTGALLFWESPEIGVVLGRGQNPAKELHLNRCAEKKLQVLRRISGGGTVLQGPGCLNYSFILPFENNPALKTIRSTSAYLLSFLCTAFGKLNTSVSIQGLGDLVLGGRKISGTAQARKKRAILFHGTLLFSLDPILIAEILREPESRPDYRGKRTHLEFVTTLQEHQATFSQSDLVQILRAVLPWETVPGHLPIETTLMAFDLARTKYQSLDWNLSGTAPEKITPSDDPTES